MFHSTVNVDKLINAMTLHSTSTGVLREILQADAGLIAVRTESEVSAAETQIDLLVTAESQAGVEYRFAVEERQSITPRAAGPLFDRMATLAPDFIPLLFCPAISPRVAELAQKAGVSWCDSAGNCRIQKLSPPLLIVRDGREPVRSERSKLADPFSPKSSRIVRVLLSELNRTWSVHELAEHKDAQVSTGLVSKVRQSLVQDAYISIGIRGTSVRDADGLLKAWGDHYRGPVSRQFYFALGEPDDIERRLFDWCRRNGLTITLSGFSAAWKLAPMVRTPVVTAYIEPMQSLATLSDQLTDETGITPVETGANLILWEPYDTSVFADRRFSEDTQLSWTSPVQTWLDLVQMKGRGQEAADEVYAQLLKSHFDQTPAEEDNGK